MTSLKQALISVSDKSHLDLLANCLKNNNLNILASDGSANYLNNLQTPIPCQNISEYTSQPEILNGRVKTLHPKIFGGILARADNQSDQEDLEKFAINNIDLIIVNLYPFADHADKPDRVDYIDIGGASLIRAAAKNYEHKLVLIDPTDYQWLIDKLQTNTIITIQDRLYFASKAFRYTAAYEQAIAQVFSENLSNNSSNNLPHNLEIKLHKVQDLRYGENPEQTAAIYNHYPQPADLISNLIPHLVQGKVLSYNNLVDSNTALEILNNLNLDESFKNLATCVIIKHATPCGVACANDSITAYQNAFKADPRSAFGGIIAINTLLNAELADYIITNQFAEVIVAPEINNDAREIIKLKPNLRVLLYKPDLNFINSQKNNLLYKFTIINNQLFPNSILVQTAMTREDLNSPQHFTVVTDNKNLNPNLLLDLKFSWYISAYVKSNAIVLSKNLTTLGIGAGQTSRIGSLELAINLAKQNNHDLNNAVLASDAFFPFPDSIELAHSIGITAIIQPGGSIQDPIVINKANELNIYMAFTHKRKFCH
ncbi:MAG: bifunctional phosphoribosylaminoimidazolecarboxamide formyltransferase/IMP cyclohydrolase [Gammaproteobacteria bacterium]|nr:bifunctional phosphoribosylaminoimidazolecarboxamide formyltransferase/IMP cyclohydrolase [Gammaproteobacteria bacterium]